MTPQSAQAHILPLGGHGWATAYGSGRLQWSHSEFEDITVLIKGHPSWRNESPWIAGPKGIAGAVASDYRKNGAAAIEQILGPFALLLFDRRNRTLVLAIDRVGIERLCFAKAGQLIVFGTSASSVSAHPLVGRTLNQQAIFNYLYCETIPSPETIYSRVEKLEPAQMLQFDSYGDRRRFYWSMRYTSAPSDHATPAPSQLIDTLRESVRCMAQGGSAGAFLSGGTDSSTVSGLLGEVLRTPAETFSIGFSAEGFDEMEYARIASKYFGTHPHEYYVTPQDVANAMPVIAAAYDEPFGNASAVPTYYCAKLAKEHGIDVMLAGDGGDEIFGGNARYAKQMMFEPYRALPQALRSMLEGSLLGLPCPNFLVPLRKLQSYITQAAVPLPDRLSAYNFLQRTPLTDVLNADFLHSVDPLAPLKSMRQSYERTQSSHPVNRMMHLDLKFILAGNDLRKVSRMCEIAGVGVRFPFLDENVVALAGQLTPRQLVKGNQLRVYFKHALKDFLPRQTLEKSKHGFGLPFGLWLNADAKLKEIVKDSLSSLAGRHIVNKAYLETIIKQHQEVHASYFGVMIWVLVQLELWLQQHATS